MGQIDQESASSGRISPAEELETFIKDRTEHVNSLVQPSLNGGRIVILDRYYYSSMAYQGCRGANVGEIRTLMESRFPIPDAVFILDIEPAIGIYRIATHAAKRLTTSRSEKT